MYGGLIDRVHDLLLCGVDPSMVDLSTCLTQIKNDHQHVYREIQSLLRAASCPWMPSHHSYMYGPEFRAYIASVCLVKVQIDHVLCFFAWRCQLILSFPVLCVCRRISVVLIVKDVMMAVHSRFSPLRCGSRSCRLFRLSSNESTMHDLCVRCLPYLNTLLLYDR